VTGTDSLPPTWAKTRLEDVSEIILGQSPPGSSYNADGIGLPFFQGSAEFGDLYPEIRKWTTKPTKLSKGGDVLLSVRAPVGPTNLAPVDCAIGRGVAAIRAVDGIEPKYLLYAIRSTESALASKGTGTTFAAVPGAVVREHLIPLAPTAEQRRIVAAIEEQFSRIDVGGSALQRARRNLQRMRAAVLQAAVTGRLVPQYPDDEPAARFLAEVNREAGPYPLPAGWLWARIEDLAEVQGGIQKQPKRRPGKNAYPFLRVANVLRSELDLSEVHMIELFDGELDRYRLRRGDLLVVEGNGSLDQIGRSALWQGAIDPCVHQNHLIRVRPGPALGPNYLNVFWNALSTAAAIQAVASSTSGLYTLSTAKVRRVLVAVPPISEQERINLEVSRQLSLIESARLNIDDVSGRVRSLKATTLGHAFAGRFVPQDSSDEPADVLLDRIKTARAAHESATVQMRRRARR